MSDKYNILEQPNTQECDDHLWWIVQQPQPMPIENLLPQCSAEGRKKALQQSFKSEHGISRAYIQEIAAYCVEHNDFDNAEMNAVLTSAVAGNIRNAVELLVRAIGHNLDPQIARLAVQLKNVHATHLFLDVFGCADLNIFQTAAHGGLCDIVERMLPFCDAKANDSFALFNAVRCKHQDCVDMLYPVSDVKLVVQRLNTNFPHHVDPLWEEFKARVGRDVLCNHLNSDGESKKTIAKRKI